MADVLWQLEGVSVDGDGRPRLRDVTCTLAPGVTLVLGPSGSGKTTLLDLLVGFERPSRGRVAFLGRSRYWMPADFGLWPHLDVRAHVELVHPGPRDVARADADRLLARLGLDHVGGHRPRALSTGQQSRVALARALATGAEALLLDEPFAHLDDDSACNACDLLVEAARQHARSLVVATHTPRMLTDVATHRLDLRDGSITASTSVAARTLMALFALLGTLLNGLLCACSDAQHERQPTPTRRIFAVPPDGARAPAPRAVATGAGDTWLVLDDAGRVLEYEGDGRVRRQWSMPEHAVGNPEGACTLRDGRIVVADTHYHRLVFFDADGSVQSLLGEQGAGPLQFGYPVSVAQDADGNIYVAEYGGNDRVQKLRADGTFVAAFGRFGSGPADLQRPAGLACHGGFVYVADAMNGRIQVFTTAGAHVRSLPAGEDLACPYDVAATSDGELLVVEYGGGCLTRLDGKGVVRGRYGRPGRGADELATPWSVAVRGALALIADTGNRRLVEVKL